MSLTAEICEICKIQLSKYTCPRCNIFYCSVPCYKNILHRICSEEFYRKCIYEELSESKNVTNPHNISEDSKKMYETLKCFERLDDISIRQTTVSDSNALETMQNSNFQLEDQINGNYEQLDSDDENTDDLSNRMEGVNLENPYQIWQNLSNDEKLHFHSWIKDNEKLANIKELAPYVPWWDTHAKLDLIQEIESEDKLDMNMPDIINYIENFDKISNKTPAECVYYNLVSILAAYTITVRFYNGDHHCFSYESSTFFSSICGNVYSNLNYDSYENAIEATCNYCTELGLTMEMKDQSSLRQDVTKIINGPANKEKSNIFILSVLSDLHKLLSSAKHTKKNIHLKNKYLTNEIINSNINLKLIPTSKINNCIKKFEYYLSYVKKYVK